MDRIKSLEQKVSELENELLNKEKMIESSNKEISRLKSIQSEFLTSSTKESIKSNEMSKLQENNLQDSSRSTFTSKDKSFIGLETNNKIKEEDIRQINISRTDELEFKPIPSIATDKNVEGKAQFSEKNLSNDNLDSNNKKEISTTKSFQKEVKNTESRTTKSVYKISNSMNEKETSNINILNKEFSNQREFKGIDKNIPELPFIDKNIEFIPSSFEESSNIFEIFQNILKKKNLIKSSVKKLEELIEKIDPNEFLEICNHFKMMYDLGNIEKISNSSNIPFVKGINFLNNSYYSGQVKDNIPHGKGVIILDSGSRISSEFIEGKISNMMLISLFNSDFYIGIFKSKGSEGVGFKVLRPANNKTSQKEEVYFGFFNHLLFHGYGKMTCDSIRIYIGYWNKDKREGFGRYCYQNGDVYEGNWLNNKRHGQGKFTTNDGAIYQGDWESDERSGYGTLNMSDGSQYIGNWKGNKKHGQGKYLSKDGGFYEGEYENDIKQGKGKLKSKKGMIYEGMFYHGNTEDEGTRIWPDGTKFIGRCVNDLKEGQGIEYTPAGEKYEGEWINGKREGKFIVTDKNGKEKKLDYSDGILIGEVCAIF